MHATRTVCPTLKISRRENKEPRKKMKFAKVFLSKVCKFISQYTILKRVQFVTLTHTHSFLPIAFDEVMKCRKLFVFESQSILVGLLSFSSPFRIPERIHAVFMSDYPIVHHLLVVADGEGVGIVYRSTLANQKMTPFFGLEFLENLLHSQLSDWSMTQCEAV